MDIKNNIKKLASFIFNMPLGLAAISICVFAFIYLSIKAIYFDVKYHFSDVAYDLMWWVIGISICLLLKWIIDRTESKKGKDS